jgi:hypothetical protein
MIADFDLFQSRSDATLDGCTTSWDNFVDAMRKFVRINVCGQGWMFNAMQLIYQNVAICLDSFSFTIYWQGSQFWDPPTSNK